MQVRIKNYRGCKSASFDATRPVWITSKENGEGKSSILSAMGLASTATPLFEVQKNEIPMMLHNGAESGFVQVGDSRAEWPGCTSGEKISSLVACGLVSLPTCKDPLSIMSDVIKATVTSDDIKSALVGLSDPAINAVCATVAKLGVDVACESYKTQGASVKGQWKQVTGGETYGIVKGSNWTPNGWTVGLESMSIDSLESDLASAKAQRDECLKHVGASEAEFERNQTTALLPAVDISKLSEELHAIGVKAHALESRRDGIPANGKKSNCSCPACNSPLIMSGTSLVLPVKNSDALDAKNATERELLAKELAPLYSEINRIENNINVINRQNAEIKIAQEWLLKNKKSEVSDSEVNRLKSEIEYIIVSISCIKSKKSADGFHNEILDIAKICDVLGPKGIKAKKISSSLEKWNLYSEKIAPEWNVQFDGLKWTFNGRTFRWLSGFEKKAVEIVSSVLYAMMNKDQVLLIDCGDKAGKKNMEILERIVDFAHKKIPCVVVAMTGEKENSLCVIGGVCEH